MRRENRKLFKNNNHSNLKSSKRTNNNTIINKSSKTNANNNFKLTKQENNKNSQTITANFKVNHSIELLEFLLLKCKTSRNNIKTLLTSRKVLVNGSVVTQYNFMLAKDDEVKLAKHSVENPNFKASKKQLNTKQLLPFNVIYQDDDFIAINKPAGLLSVESDNDRTCAFGYLLNYLTQIDKNLRPYILHRIDKETSGVLIFTKNIKLHSMLKLNWNDFVKTREYIAIVEGNLEKPEDTITSYLKENKNNIVYSTRDISGQKAITQYKVINKTEDYSLLKVNIETGRKNQIRVHMNDINHPIIGDDKYGHTKNPINRLGLHASKLEFIHPLSHNLISISAPMPDSFKKLFKK